MFVCANEWSGMYADCTCLRSIRRSSTHVQSVTNRSSTSTSCVCTWLTMPVDPSTHVDTVTRSSRDTPSCEHISATNTSPTLLTANQRTRNRVMVVRNVTSTQQLGIASDLFGGVIFVFNVTVLRYSST